MRWGYSPFTHRTFVSRPSGSCQTSTIRMLASFQRYRAATSVAPGSNGRTLAGSWSVAHAGGLGPRSEGPHGAFRSRSRTDCRLKGFRSARSQSSSQDRRCTITTASSWSTLRGALQGLSEIIGPFPVPSPRDKRERNDDAQRSPRGCAIVASRVVMAISWKWADTGGL